MPEAPPLATPVTVRLMSTDSSQSMICWDASYDAGITYNQVHRFKAKSD
jgi:hypothetical protein